MTSKDLGFKAGSSIKNFILGLIGPVLKQAHRYKSKTTVIGSTVQEHFFMGKLAKLPNGRLAPIDGRHVPNPCLLPGPPRKHIRKSRELLSLWNVQVKPVKVTRSERIDRSKYSGAHLREIRAANGVGRPPGTRRG